MPWIFIPLSVYYFDAAVVSLPNIVDYFAHIDLPLHCIIVFINLLSN